MARQPLTYRESVDLVESYGWVATEVYRIEAGADTFWYIGADESLPHCDERVFTSRAAAVQAAIAANQAFAVRLAQSSGWRIAS